MDPIVLAPAKLTRLVLNFCQELISMLRVVSGLAGEYVAHLLDKHHMQHVLGI